MNTKNLKVKCLKKATLVNFTEGKLYSVNSAKKILDFGHCIEIRMETDIQSECGVCWMKESMQSGDLSLSECFELVVEEDLDLRVKNDDIKEAMKYSIDCALEAGRHIHNELIGSRKYFDGDDRSFIFYVNGKKRVFFGLMQDKAGSVPLSERGDKVISYEVLTELRNVLRCPDGANIVTWAEILAAGYFGEKHQKGGAIEDAIHYKKNGAYSEETLAKILAAIVNDGTNC